MADEACGFGYELAVVAAGARGGGMGDCSEPCGTRAGIAGEDRSVDVGKLARKLEKGDLKAIYIPSRPVHEQRQLGRTYAQSIKERKPGSAGPHPQPDAGRGCLAAAGRGLDGVPRLAERAAPARADPGVCAGPRAVARGGRPNKPENA